MKENHDTMPEREGKKITKGKRALIIGVALLILVMGFAAGWLGAYFSVDSRLRNLGWMIDRVADNYYQDIDKDDLYNSLFKKLELDKFCTYYTREQYQTVVGESNGNNAGYGIGLYAYEADPHVYSVVGNSPFDLAGIRRGMYIHAFGPSEEALQKGTRGELLDYLAAHNSCTLKYGYDKEGSDAKIVTVSRASYLGSYCIYSDSEGTFRFRGEKSLVLTQTEGGMSALDGDTAYIRLTEFDGNAAAEFKVCLQTMKVRGRTNLVIDLRSNGGGYVSTMCDIVSHLMRDATEKKPVVMRTKYRSGKTTVYRATGNDFSTYFSESSRIRVLLDEYSASASEALVGAMIDYGTVQGSDIYVRISGDPEKPNAAHSYGKGVMQSTFVAPNGAALRLTVAQIFWPNGKSIHETGIGEAHGVIPVAADLLPSATDSFLEQALA